MNEEEKMHLMKKRIIGSYAWQRDLIKPLSRDFDCSEEELEDVLFKRLNMSDLEAAHSTFSTAKELDLYQKFIIDLRIHWLGDILELISEDDCEILIEKLVGEVLAGKDYDAVLKEGHKNVFQLIKGGLKC